MPTILNNWSPLTVLIVLALVGWSLPSFVSQMVRACKGLPVNPPPDLSAIIGWLQTHDATLQSLNQQQARVTAQLQTVATALRAQQPTRPTAPPQVMGQSEVMRPQVEIEPPRTGG